MQLWSKAPKPARLILLLLVMVPVSVCSAQTPPENQAALPDTADNYTATILFIQGRPQRELPAGIAEIRAAGVSRLEAALRGRGHRTLERALTESKVVKWRVRGSHLVAPEFLRELREEENVGQVFVATLLSENARFLMTVRLIDTLTGMVTFVDLTDVDLVPDPVGNTTADLASGVQDWRIVLDQVCLDIAPPWTPAPEPREDTVLAMPTKGIASDPAITSAAAHSLLKVLIENGLALIDPGLIEVTMLEAGRPSHWLDATGRRALLGRFGVDIVLVSELVSYDINTSSNAVLAIDGEGGSVSRRNLTVFALTLRAVDLNTGTAVQSAQIIHEQPPASGWFGNPIHTTLLQELDTTSHNLWAEFSPEAEDD